MIDVGEPRFWNLKGQGNANAVFAYVGNTRELDCLVLRIPKASDSRVLRSDAFDSLETSIWSPVLAPSISGAAERKAAYEEEVLRPLLGSQYIHTGRQCQLPPEFACALTAQLGGAYKSLSCEAWLLPDHTLFRQTAEKGSLCKGSSVDQIEGRAAPAVRWHADDSQGGCQAAWETSEMGQAGTLCVEIKPKCGFLPTSALIRPEHAVKRRVPRFQLHQLLKLEQGKIQRLSSYNPLDLFSGSPQRMEAALAALFEEPQNNLRLFLGGAAVQLPKDGKLPGGPTMQQLGGVSGLIRLLRIILLREGVLDRILEVQKMDVHDIEGIHPLLAALLQRQATLSQSANTPNCWQHAANEYKQVPRAQPDAATPAGDNGPANIAQELCDAELARLLSADWPAACAALRGYLTAATAKDCSLMITLALLQPPSAPQQDGGRSQTPGQSAAMDGLGVGGRGCAGGGSFQEAGTQLPAVQEDPDVGSVVQDSETRRWFRYKVAVVDLDLKPLRKIEQHFVLDRQILDCAMRTGVSG